jgi:putative transposase
MARPLRIEQADTFYHIINRGNDRRSIFSDDEDRNRFLDFLGTCSERFDFELWAYVLMRNHYHLLLRTHQPNLSRAVQWLGVTYSVYYNNRHKRSGHLFQGRFKSFLIFEEEYLKSLILYIHRNPLRAGIVDRLQDYMWSSYCGLGYGRGSPKWFNANYVLDYFKFGRKDFRRAIAFYDEQSEDLLSNLWYGLVLGSSEMVSRMKEKLKQSVNKEQPQTRKLNRHGSILELADKYRKMLGIPEGQYEQYFRPIRHRRRFYRDVLIYLIWRSDQFSLNEIGRYFNVSYTAISNCRRRGLEYIKSNRKLKKLLSDTGFKM